VERVTKIKVDSMIPSSRLVPTSLNKGVPVVADQPRSDVAKAVMKLADRFRPNEEESTAAKPSAPKKRLALRKS
jgi:MinD-like ATPase involved in chromosome partitioning or flagellar assembly